MVVTPNPEVAAWAAQPIQTGPNMVFQPLVLGPGAVPWVTRKEDAEKVPELAVLSVQAHANEPGVVEIALAALAGASSLDAERAMLYFDLVYMAVNKAARAKLEELMQGRTYEYQSDFARKYLSQGRAEGLAEGVSGGIIAVLEARGLGVSDQDRKRILGCENIETLERWLRLAVKATEVQKIFEE